METPDTTRMNGSSPRDQEVIRDVRIALSLSEIEYHDQYNESEEEEGFPMMRFDNPSEEELKTGYFDPEAKFVWNTDANDEVTNEVDEVCSPRDQEVVRDVRIALSLSEIEDHDQYNESEEEEGFPMMRFDNPSEEELKTGYLDPEGKFVWNTDSDENEVTNEVAEGEEYLLDTILGALLCQVKVNLSSGRAFLEAQANRGNESCQRLLKMWNSGCLKPSTQKSLALAAEALAADKSVSTYPGRSSAGITFNDVVDAAPDSRLKECKT